jgi:hypothetical protein
MGLGPGRLLLLLDELVIVWFKLGCCYSCCCTLCTRLAAQARCGPCLLKGVTQTIPHFPHWLVNVYIVDPAILEDKSHILQT